MKIIDPIALEQMIGDDHDLLADLAIMFCQMLPDAQARLRVAIEDHNASLLDRVANQIRNRASYFGATKIERLAECIESQAKAHDFREITITSAELFEQIDDLLTDLRSLTRLQLEVSDD